MKYLGVAYLLYVAWSTLRDAGTLSLDTAGDAKSTRQVIGSAILINILNPKLSIFFLAFLPQFVRPNEPDTISHMIGLSGVFMLLTCVVFTGYGLFAASVRTQISSRPRLLVWLRRTFAGAFVALGFKLALTER